VDLDNAKLSSTSTVRGWDNLPAFTGNGGAKAARHEGIPETTRQSPADTPPGAESWQLTLATPMGPQLMAAKILRSGAGFTGSMSSSEMPVQDISGKSSGNKLSWTLSLTKPVSIKLSFEANVDGDKMTGTVKLGMFGKAALTGKRV
jgi:carbon-monoxide dehydrogenase large subunit